MDITELKQLIPFITSEIIRYNDLTRADDTTKYLYIFILISSILTFILESVIIFEYITSADPKTSKADAYIAAIHTSIAASSTFTMIFILNTGMMPDVFAFFIVTILFYRFALFVRGDH